MATPSSSNEEPEIWRYVCLWEDGPNISSTGTKTAFIDHC